ncbi:TPA: terminase small subunit [Shewanella algae]|uniref:terminase small subunit n=1 Tax=Shewanella algae TaxID=38313 RepID=UPI001182E477|nr:terminase small subunit [Shewanella algae]EKT4486707.1 terminase small subunit [Shewanella algae]TVK95362.1 hypothetical protein AYJ01_00820 [Shewanella algae]HDS1207497.1 terminase small subunit [Shewanella algae]
MSKSQFDWSIHKYTDFERRFIAAYVELSSKKEAAVKAGSKSKEPAKVGYITYNRPHVREAIDWHINKSFEEAGVSSERIIRELAMVAFADMAPIFNEDGSLKPFKEWPQHCRRALSGLEVDELFEGQGEDREQIGFTKKFKQWNKVAALELLGKHKKMWTDKVEVAERPKVIRRYDGVKG